MLWSRSNFDPAPVPATKNERIARFFEGIARSLIFLQKNEQFVRKPMSKFPALWKWSFEPEQNKEAGHEVNNFGSATMPDP